jgi:hypothetical protein
MFQVKLIALHETLPTLTWASRMGIPIWKVESASTLQGVESTNGVKSGRIQKEEYPLRPTIVGNPI